MVKAPYPVKEEHHVSIPKLLKHSEAGQLSSIFTTNDMKAMNKHKAAAADKPSINNLNLRFWSGVAARVQIRKPSEVKSTNRQTKVTYSEVAWISASEILTQSQLRPGQLRPAIGMRQLYRRYSASHQKHCHRQKYRANWLNRGHNPLHYTLTCSHQQVSSIWHIIKLLTENDPPTHAVQFIPTPQSCLVTTPCCWHRYAPKVPWDSERGYHKLSQQTRCWWSCCVRFHILRTLTTIAIPDTMVVATNLFLHMFVVVVCSNVGCEMWCDLFVCYQILLIGKLFSAYFSQQVVDWVVHFGVLCHYILGHPMTGKLGVLLNKLAADDGAVEGSPWPRVLGLADCPVVLISSYMVWYVLEVGM